MTDANEVLSQVRDFVYIESPDEDARWTLYETLRQNPAIADLWRPMFQQHPRWGTEPLVWTHIKGMDGGMLPVYGPKTTSMDDYAAVFPKGAIKLFVKGGNGLHNTSPEPPPEAHMKRCVQIRIDNPEWSFDDGQNGGGEGSADIKDTLKNVWFCLKGTLRAVHTFELIAARQSRWDVWGGDDEGRRPVIQTSLWPPSFAEKDRGFGTLKKLIGRRKLKRFRLTNRESLSESNWRTGKTKPYCDWLPRYVWWPELTALDLSDNGLDRRDVPWLFPIAMPQMRELSLAHNPLDDEAIEDLVREGFFPKLEHFDLRGTRVTEQAVERLRGDGLLPSLKACLLDPV